MMALADSGVAVKSGADCPDGLVRQDHRPGLRCRDAHECTAYLIADKTHRFSGFVLLKAFADADNGG